MPRLICLSLGLFLGAAASARAADPDLAALWDDLAVRDVRGFRAVWQMAGAGDKAVEFLGGKLHPVAGNRKVIARWIADLDDDDFAKREAATEALEKLGRAADPAVRAALRDTSSAEVRRRCERILARVEPSPRADSLEELRAARAVHVLEQIGTPAAQKALKRLAGGADGARLTEDARAALRRLTGR